MNIFTFKMAVCLGICLSLHVFVYAQPGPAGEVRKIISSGKQYFMNAEWSPDGERFAFSRKKFNGIWVSNARGDSIRQITSDRSAGFGYQWSPGGQSLLARPVVIREGKRHHQIKLYEVESPEEKLLLPASREIQRLPVWINGGREVAVKEKDRIKRVSTGKSSVKSHSSGQSVGMSFGGSLVAVPRDGLKSTRQVVFPEFEGRYIFNSRISPDGKKVVFQVSGLGLFAARIDGTQKRHLGHGEDASWMPDSRYVVVTKVADDGHRITSGNLFAVDTRTGEYFPLLAHQDIIALKPSVSPDGDRVLFNDPRSGDIYMMKISNR